MNFLIKISDIFFKIIQKSLLAFVFLAFATATLYIPTQINKVETVDAVLPTIDALNYKAKLLEYGEMVYNTASTIASEAYSSITAYATQYLQNKELVLDGIYWALAKAALSVMLSSLVKWINNGFKGSPMFVQNLKQYLMDTADRAVMDFLESSNLNGIVQFLCSPFKLSVKVAVTMAYSRSRDNIPRAGGCRLSDIENNINDFLSNTQDAFSKNGGWDTWFSITASPSTYTPYGSVLEVQSQVEALVRDAKGEELEILRFGQGFLSTKVCEESSNSSTILCSIVNPGKVIVEAINNNLDSSRQSLITADEISEVLVALFQQLSTKLITSANGLLAGSEGTGRTIQGMTVEEMDGRVVNDFLNNTGLGEMRKQINERICVLKKLGKDIGPEPATGDAANFASTTFGGIKNENAIFDMSPSEEKGCGFAVSNSGLGSGSVNGKGDSSGVTGSGSATTTGNKFDVNLVDEGSGEQYLARLMEVEQGLGGKEEGFKDRAAKEVDAILGTDRKGDDGILFNLTEHIKKLTQWKTELNDIGSNAEAGNLSSYASINTSVINEITTSLNSNNAIDSYAKGPNDIYSVADVNTFVSSWLSIIEGKETIDRVGGLTGTAQSIIDVQYGLTQKLSDGDYVNRLNYIISNTNDDDLKKEAQNLKGKIIEVKTNSNNCTRDLNREIDNYNKAKDDNKNRNRNDSENKINEIINGTDDNTNNTCYTEDEISQYVSEWESQVSSLESRM